MDLHNVLRRYKKVVVFHGHEHIGYYASKDDMTVVSAPSVAYGDRKGGPNCFVYELDPDSVQPRQRVRVVDQDTFTAK